MDQSKLAVGRGKRLAKMSSENSPPNSTILVGNFHYELAQSFEKSNYNSQVSCENVSPLYKEIITTGAFFIW